MKGTGMCVALLLCALGAGACKRSEKPTIGVVVYQYDNTLVARLRHILSTVGKKHARILIVDSQASQSIQNKHIDQFIALGVHGLAVNLVDHRAARTVIEKAQQARIPLVFFNRMPDLSDLNRYARAYYVGVKDDELGLLQSRLVAQYLERTPSADKNADGIIQCVVLKGDPDHKSGARCARYVCQALREIGLKGEIIGEAFALDSRVKGQAAMHTLIHTHGDRIEAVFANNDDAALGAIEALQSAGFFKENKRVPVVGIDATASALKAIEEDLMLGTVLNDVSSQGKAILNLLFALMGDSVPSIPAEDSTAFTHAGNGVAGRAAVFGTAEKQCVWIPYKVVTKENYRTVQNYLR